MANPEIDNHCGDREIERLQRKVQACENRIDDDTETINRLRAELTHAKAVLLWHQVLGRHIDNVAWVRGLEAAKKSGHLPEIPATPEPSRTSPTAAVNSTSTS